MHCERRSSETHQICTETFSAGAQTMNETKGPSVVRQEATGTLVRVEHTQPIHKINLMPEQEVVGQYEKLRIGADTIGLVLRLTVDKNIEVSFPIESSEAEVMRKEFHSFRTGQKVGILRISDAKIPILIRKFRCNENKEKVKDKSRIKGVI